MDVVGDLHPSHFAEVQVEFDFRKLGVCFDLGLGAEGLFVLAISVSHDDVEDASSVSFEPGHGFGLSVIGFLN